MEHADEGFAAVEGSRPPCVELHKSNVIGVGPAVNHRVTFRLSAQTLPGQSSKHRKRRRRGGRRPCQNFERKGKRRNASWLCLTLSRPNLPFSIHLPRRVANARTTMRSPNSSNGTAQNRDWHSIEPSCCG